MFRNGNAGFRKFARNSAYNAVVGAAQRIQQRRTRRGRRRLVRRDMSTVARRPGMFQRTGRIGNSTQLRGLMRSTASNIGTSVVNSLYGMQPIAGVRMESGTELIAELRATESSLIQLDEIINPADPGMFPGLSATANQYQKFRTTALSITYTPTAPTNTAGTVYMAFVADPNFVAPTTLQGIIQLQGLVQSPVYGKSVTIDIPKTSMQQSYNIQTIQKPADPKDQTPLISSGKFMCFLTGIDSNGPDVYGNLTMSYSYTFHSKQLTQGSNGLRGTVHLDVDNTDHLLHATEWADYKILEETDLAANIFKVRMPGARYHLSEWTTSVTGAGATELQVDVSDNGTDWTNVPDDFVFATTNARITTREVPPSRYWRLTLSNTHDDAGSWLEISSMPAVVRPIAYVAY